MGDQFVSVRQAITTYKSNAEVVELFVIVLVRSIDKRNVASFFVHNCVRLATFARGLAFAGGLGDALAASFGGTLAFHLEGFAGLSAGLGLRLGFTGCGLGGCLDRGFLLSCLC